jgi:hypothetical protein
MTESQVVNRWVSQGKLEQARLVLIRLLKRRFGDALPGEALETIKMQPSLPLLEDWIDAVVTAQTLQDYLAVLRS